MNPEKNTLHYGWLLLPLCLGNVIISHGISSAFSVIFVHLLQETGIRRADLSGIFSVYMLIFFSGGMLVGPLLDRVGARILIPAGAFIAGLGLLGCSVITSTYTLFFYYGFITALGVCCMSWIPNSVVIGDWFPHNRGTAVGLVMSGSGLAILIFIPLTQVLIEWSGWRSTFQIIALITILAVIPANAIFQRRKHTALSPPTTAGGHIGKGPLTLNNLKKFEWSVSKAIRQKTFWMICFASFFNPFFTFSMMLHQVAMVVDQGYDTLTATTRLGFVGIFTMFGRLSSGALSDRIGREPAYTLFMGFAAVGLLSLYFATPDHPWALSFYVVFGGFGLGVGGAMFPTMLADMFPGPNLGSIIGFTAIFSGIGACFGSWLVGYSYDISGSYTLGLIFLFTAVLAAIFFVWLAAPKSGERRYSV